MVILLYGPPGCGKGTQSAHISRRFQIPAISTGDMLRASCEDGSTESRQVKHGILVSDDLVNRMVSRRVAQPDCDSGFLLDGYPRTVPQARFLQGLIDERRLPEPTVIHLDVPHAALLARVTSRRQCPACGRIYNLLYSAPAKPGRCDDDGAALTRRADDDEGVVVDRLNDYDRMAGPLFEHYRNGRYVRVDGNRPPAEICRDIERVLETAEVRVRSHVR